MLIESYRRLEMCLVLSVHRSELLKCVFNRFLNTHSFRVADVCYRAKVFKRVDSATPNGRDVQYLILLVDFSPADPNDLVEFRC